MILCSPAYSKEPFCHWGYCWMASYPFRICPQQNLVLYCFNMRSTHIVKVLHKINATLVQNLDNIRYLRCVITFYSVIYCCLKIHEMFFIKNLLLSSMFFFLNVTLEKLVHTSLEIKETLYATIMHPSCFSVTDF